jgi:hypothetical protein
VGGDTICSPPFSNGGRGGREGGRQGRGMREGRGEEVGREEEEIGWRVERS